MNKEYFTEDNLQKVLDNQVYNFIAANEDTNIVILEYMLERPYGKIVDSIGRLIKDNCIVSNDSTGRLYHLNTVGFGGNFPPKCIEHY